MVIEKKENKKKIAEITIILMLIFVVIGILEFKKPSITGKVVQGQENVFIDNLHLKLNESGTYEWKVKNPGDIKSIKATGSVSHNGTAKVYIEKNGTKHLLFDSTKQLFDVNIHVLPEYKKIFQGDDILIQITLLNLRGFGSGNINVKYSIKDSKGNIIASEEENVYVETQAKFVRKLLIPQEIKPATYIAFVDAFTDVLIGSGSDTFEVKAKYEPKPQSKYYINGAAAVVGAIIISILIVYLFWMSKKKKKIVEVKEEIPKEKIDKLERELKALEGAHGAKFISEESYKKQKERIETELTRLKNKQ